MKKGGHGVVVDSEPWWEADDPDPTADLTMTLNAFQLRPWQGVLLRPRAKAPSGRRWQITRDVDRIARHLRSGGNLGLITHQTTGLAVLDADHLLPWADMVDALGQPAPCWVETGSGTSLHYYIAWEDDLPAKLEWEGQIVGEIQRGPAQQMIVCPPSIHPVTGQRYRWLGFDPSTQPLSPLPGEWRAFLRAFTYAASYDRRRR
jgi:hypothetical protein